MNTQDLSVRRALSRKPSKMGNKRTVIDGQAFGSKAEARRGAELKLEQWIRAANHVQWRAA